MGKEPRSAKSVLALFSQEQLGSFLILDLELGAFLLNATGGSFDHVVYRNVPSFQHGIEVEGGRTGSVHSDSNPEASWRCDMSANSPSSL